MTDEKFEEFLKRAAETYNAPPARAPREEMWNAIRATRAAGPRVVYGGASNLRSSGEKRIGSKAWWAAAAGLLLVASGVGIGRWTASPNAPAVNTAAAPRSTARQARANEPVSAAPVSQAAPAAASAARATELPEQSSRVVASGRRERSSIIASVAAPNGGPSPEGNASPERAASPGAAPTSAYQFAEVNHLSEAEALLTSFRTRSSADRQQDARLASWARELLSNTRLLLDSPLAADPRRRPLLQDLELLLVQIVQLSPGGTPRDREIMEKTLQQDQLMTRLRTAIPAGQRGS